MRKEDNEFQSIKKQEEEIMKTKPQFEGKKWVKTSVFWVMFFLCIGGIFMIGFISGTLFGVHMSVEAGKELFSNVKVDKVEIGLNETLLVDYMTKQMEKRGIINVTKN